MSFFPSLPGDADLPRILGLNPGGRRALIAAQDAVFAGASRLTTADKELIGAYASALTANAHDLPSRSVVHAFAIDTLD